MKKVCMLILIQIGNVQSNVTDLKINSDGDRNRGRLQRDIEAKLFQSFHGCLAVASERRLSK